MDRSNLYVLHAVALWFWISGARNLLQVVQYLLNKSHCRNGRGMGNGARCL